MIKGFYCERCLKEYNKEKFVFLSTLCKDCKKEIEQLINETYKLVKDKELNNNG